MANNNGYVIASLTPGWIKKRVPDNYADDVLKDLIMFYVIMIPLTIRVRAVLKKNTKQS